MKHPAPADRRRHGLHCISNIGLLQSDPGVHAAGARSRSKLPHPHSLPRGQWVLWSQGRCWCDPCSLHPHRQTVLQPGVPAGPAEASTPAWVSQTTVDVPRQRWGRSLTHCWALYLITFLWLLIYCMKYQRIRPITISQRPRWCLQSAYFL